MSRTAQRATELAEQGTPFVQATVVRAQCPTSARPGDSALVLGDGSIEGFIGGQCAEGSVRTAAVPLLASGQALLLRILPEGPDGDVEHFPESEGAMTVVNPCLSGGAVEVFLEPRLPAARLAVVGNTPIAESLEVLGGHLGYAVQRSATLPHVAGCTAVIVSSHGRHEPETIRAALDAGVEFVGLVASRTRGAAVLDELGLTDEERTRVHSPIGVHIGARTAEEIALSILASVVKAVRVDGIRAPDGAQPEPAARPATAIDPVCGMTVTVMPDTPHLHHDGTDFWFCNPGCRVRHAEELV
ncbi:MAG: XdhC family protein [Actinomycetota bacterium]